MVVVLIDVVVAFGVVVEDVVVGFSVVVVDVVDVVVTIRPSSYFRKL